MPQQQTQYILTNVILDGPKTTTLGTIRGIRNRMLEGELPGNQQERHEIDGLEYPEQKTSNLVDDAITFGDGHTDEKEDSNAEVGSLGLSDVSDLLRRYLVFLSERGRHSCRATLALSRVQAQTLLSHT